MIHDPQLIRHREVMERDLPPLVWDVEPLISRGDRVVIFGEFASMKSWLGLSLVGHLGAGKAWLDTFPIPDTRNALYVDEEMNERTLRRRHKRLSLGAGIDSEAAPGLALLSRAGVYFDTYGAGSLLSALKRHEYQPQVIIVDALRRVMPGDENEAKDVAAFWRNLEPLSRQGITLVVMHHMTKPPQAGRRAARYRASGSTDILAGSDASFAVERVGDQTCKVTAIKARDDREYAPFVVEMSDGGDRSAPVRLWVTGSMGSKEGSKEPYEPAPPEVLNRPLWL